MPKKIDSNDNGLDIHDIEYLICHIASMWRRLVGIKIKALGISTMEKRVLFAIARHPGLTQVQIANLLELEPQNLIRILDRLENQAWLEKRANPQDRRAKCLFVTREAKKMITQIRTLSQDIKPQILAGMDEVKIHTIVSQLTDIRENLFRELEVAEDA